MKKIIFITLGYFFVILATLGIFIPLLPTTPFLLLASYFFIRSSEKMYYWITRNKFYGKYLHDYIEQKKISYPVVLFTLILLWAGIGSSAIFFIHAKWGKVVLFLISIAVSIHVVKMSGIFRNK